MKNCLCLATLVLLSGCINIEIPGLVADTAKVATSAYQAVVGPADAASAPVPARITLSHAYVGTDKQSIADLKLACVNEASDKLTKLSGKAVAYTVTENAVVMINGQPVANCKLLVS